MRYKLESANHSYSRWQTKFFYEPSDRHAEKRVLDICREIRKDYWNAKSIPVTLWGESKEGNADFSRVVLIVRTDKNPL